MQVKTVLDKVESEILKQLKDKDKDKDNCFVGDSFNVKWHRWGYTSHYALRVSCVCFLTFYQVVKYGTSKLLPKVSNETLYQQVIYAEPYLINETHREKT